MQAANLIVLIGVFVAIAALASYVGREALTGPR